MTLAEVGFNQESHNILFNFVIIFCRVIKEKLKGTYKNIYVHILSVNTHFTNMRNDQ